MAGSTAEWDRYLRWNGAVAEVVYSPEAAGTPVYLDLDDDVLAAVCDVAEPGADDPASTLSEVVKGTLVLRYGASRVLRSHLHRLETWRRGSMLDPPPTLALLAMLSLVAETMHAGEGMKQHNFYGRLAELLDLNVQELGWLRSAYRRQDNGAAVSVRLWGSLNDWLETLEGNRGLPTAMALGHEHVGLPLSQALVRRTDREKFGDLFALNSLPPRSALPAFDMENLISEWMSRRPCPASNTLERLWKAGPDLRARITSVALQTLATWDGVSETSPNQGGSSRAPVDIVRAKAALRSFPSRRLDVGLALPARSTEEVELYEAVDADGTVVGSLELVPAASGYLGLADPDAIDSGSFLSGDVLLRKAGQSQTLRRRARRVVPMRYDDLLLAYVECERVQLGEEVLLLVRSVIAPTVVKVLEAIARPGFVVTNELPGLPDEWTLVSSVQVLSSIPDELRKQVPVDINVVQPLASSQVVLQGGLRLPGNIAKWSSFMPPELRVSAESEEGLAASIRCTRELVAPPPIDRAAKGTGTVLIWDFAQEELPDGDYEITIQQDCQPQRVETLRLRSADNPAVRVDRDLPPIGHDPTTPSFGLIAVRTMRGDAIRGVHRSGLRPPAGDPPSVPTWFVARQGAKSQRVVAEQVRFPAPDDKSCMVTGAHLMSIETAMSGMTTVEGVCQHCGLIKRYPAMRGRNRSRRARATGVAPKVNVLDVCPVRAHTAINWTVAFDAVCHLGGGAASALRRVASQMEGTDLFSDVFERRLELFGHIEIERDPRSLAPKSWQVVEPLVIGLGDGSATITGFRSERMMTAVEDHIWACGGTFAKDHVDAPPVVRIEGLAATDLNDLASVMTETAGMEAKFVPNAAEQLCASLPPLSRASEGLPTTTSTSARSYEAWNPTTARFEQTRAPLGPGTYRLTGYSRCYIHRRAEDIGAMRATLGDARIVKYLAAADVRQSLLGYDADDRVLYVPLGADLPGLYGRVAVLASGLPPVENVDDRILEYRNVSPQLAGALDHLLMS